MIDLLSNSIILRAEELLQFILIFYFIKYVNGSNGLQISVGQKRPRIIMEPQSLYGNCDSHVRQMLNQSPVVKGNFF